MTPLKPHEAELLGAISAEERAAWHYQPGPATLDPANRAADRLLWSKVEELLAKKVRWSPLAQALGVSAGRLLRLRAHCARWGQPVQTEDQIAARQARKTQEEAERRANDAEAEAEWLAAREAWKVQRRADAKRWRAEARQQERDEAREIRAQSLYCLIEAYEEMRGHPTVGPLAARVPDCY